jgi:hypothetical protein
MTVHVGVIEATRRRSGPSIIRIVRVTRTRWAILIRHATTRRRTAITSFTPIIVLAARGWAAAVVVPARAVTTRGSATVVVVVVRRRWVSPSATTAAHGRARSVSVTAAVIRTTRASVRSPRLEWRRWGRIRDVLDALDFLSLELTAVELLHCGLQIGGCLILDESALC